MTTTERGWLPAAAGLAVMLLGLFVVWTLVGPAASESDASAEEAPPVVAEPVVPEPAVHIEPSVTVITTPPPQMEGLSESIARVLATSGFASELTVDDIADSLPGSVYRTLVDQGVTLTIATEDAGR